VGSRALASNINKKFSSLFAEMQHAEKKNAVQIVIKLLHNATQTVRSVWQEQQKTVSCIATTNNKVKDGLHWPTFDLLGRALNFRFPVSGLRTHSEYQITCWLYNVLNLVLFRYLIECK